MLDGGKAQIAYRIARDTALPSKESLRVDQPFTAGWIALRFLDDPRSAAQPVLIGYVTAAHAFDERDLAAKLAVDLPSHMVPARIIRLDAFPLTTSGKVDRKKLPDPIAARSPTLAPPPAATAIEQALVDIWRKILGHERFSCLDGFFDVGGTSLGTMRMVSAIADRLGRPLPIVSVFRHPTIRDLAAHLDKAIVETESNHLDEARGRAVARRAMHRARWSS